MQNYPRQRLAAIIAQYSPQIAEEPARLRGLLNDYLKGKYKLESSLLVAAAEERIPAALTSTRLPKAILFSQLATRLQQERAFTAEAANWAVESWALALGVIDAPYQHPTAITQPPQAAPLPTVHLSRLWAIPGYVTLLAAITLYLVQNPWCLRYAWLCPLVGGIGAAGVIIALYDTMFPTLTFLLLVFVGFLLRDGRPDWLFMTIAGLGAALSLFLFVAARRREPVTTTNARLRPETTRQLQAYLRYYVGGQILYAPFAPLIEQYRRIRLTVGRHADWQRILLSSEDIMAIDPMDFQELENRFHQALHEYRAFHDRLISRMVIGTPLMNAPILQQARLDPAFEATYTARLAAAASVLQPALQELETQRHTLQSYMPELRNIFSRGGISELIAGLLELLPIHGNPLRLVRQQEERFLIQIAHALEQYLQRWDNLVQQIDATVIPSHQQIYEGIIEQSLRKSTALFDEFDKSNVPLRPLLSALKKSNRQAAKVLQQRIM